MASASIAPMDASGAAFASPLPQPDAAYEETTRPRRQGKHRRPNSAASSPRPASAAGSAGSSAASGAAQPSGWRPDAQAALSYGMPYAFADGRELLAVSIPGRDCYSLTPMLIHAGHAVVPHLAWEWPAFAAAQQQQQQAQQYAFSGGSGSGRHARTPQPQQQQSFHQAYRGNVQYPSRRGQNQRQSLPPQQQSNGGRQHSCQNGSCGELPIGRRRGNNNNIITADVSSASVYSEPVLQAAPSAATLPPSEGDSSSVTGTVYSAPASPELNRRNHRSAGRNYPHHPHGNAHQSQHARQQQQNHYRHNDYYRGGGGGPRHHRARSAASAMSLDALPSVLDSSEDAPDLERFLQAATPAIACPRSPEAVAALRLSDLWVFYERPSVFGLECTTLGGPRGPSNSYFVPYLSAVNLYVPVGGDDEEESSTARAAAAEEAGDDVDGAGETFWYPQGLESWPSSMRLAFSWAASEHVGDRPPMHARIAELSGGRQDHLLTSSRLLDLHPYSWYSVAWYPVYRIPDAPLTARFLTFHSLAPMWEAAKAAEAQAADAADQRRAASGLTAAAAEAAGAAAAAASYKLMLEAGNHASGAGGVGAANCSASGVVTPTAVLSTAGAFPGSPLSSDATMMPQGGASGVCSSAATTLGTGSASGGLQSRPLSVVSVPATASESTTSVDPFGSLAPSPAGSDSGDDRPTALWSGTGSDGGSAAATAAAGALTAPAVGLCWHTAGSAAGENWTDTLVTVNLPGEPLRRGLMCGDALPGPSNASVAGVWPHAAVIRKDYPLAKGGPLSWEIQLEELEEGARRLALRQGLVKTTAETAARNSGGGQPLGEGEEERESCCPDYDFFASRRR